MKKIIKPAITTFYAKCPGCGCEFTYEKSDILGHSDDPYVSCPSCNKLIDHKPTEYVPEEQHNYVDYNHPKVNWQRWDYYYDQYTGRVVSDPCVNCPNRTSSLELGDSPCQWCKYGYRVTCNTAAGGNTGGTEQQ